MSKWVQVFQKADFKGIGQKLGIDPVIVRLICNRGIKETEAIFEFLEPKLDSFESPYVLKDIELACELLMDAIDEEKHIRVVGDYDVDGIMSTYILTNAIKKSGGNVDYVVPNRMIDGYGINPDMVQKAYDEGVEFIITCDNGIAAREACELAKSLGITYVVTDHHEVPYDEINGEKKYLLPKADAIVNPKQSDCPSKFKGICGAQVVFKLVFVLFDMLGLEDDVWDYLEFAAMACVCDVMELKGENRALVFHGLKAIAKTKNPGLHAILARNDLTGKKVTCYHVGFVLGPCFNASGRLDTAMMAISLLEETDFAKALVVAQELVELNTQRKSMTQAGLDEAKNLIVSQGMENDRVLVLYIPKLHESLAGIVAGRIKEAYYRPTLVFTEAEQGAKGSGRSIEAYDMFAELTKVKELFTKYGGHPMAAGVSLPIENIDELRKRLNQNCVLTEDDLEETIKIDVDMPLAYIHEALINSIERLEPFGNGNPKPVFAQRNVRIVSASYIGKEKQFIRLEVLTEENKPMTAMLFRNVDAFRELISSKYSKDTYEKLFSKSAGDVTINIIYQPTINEFNGRTSIQIIIDNFK